MKKPLLALLFSSVLFADCTPQEEQKANRLWQNSQTMHGIQKSQTLSNALQTCPLSKIKVDFYIDAIENQLNQGELTLEILNGLRTDLFDTRSINNSLSIRSVRNRNSNKITRLTDKIASIEKKIQTNQERLEQLRAYRENSGTKRAIGSGERLMLPVLFANGSSKVENNKRIRDLIERIKITLKDDKNAKFTITGYASSRGRAKGNKKLSKRRAYNIQKYIEKYIEKGHIYISGQGESRLICNHGFAVDKGNGEYECQGGTENEASSRRIEILRR